MVEVARLVLIVASHPRAEVDRARERRRGEEIVAVRAAAWTGARDRVDPARLRMTSYDRTCALLDLDVERSNDSRSPSRPRRGRGTEERDYCRLAPRIQLARPRPASIVGTRARRSGEV